MIAQDETVYYDRAFINQLYGSGFHLVNDLVPLYQMKSYLKKYANLSPEARKRIKWMDYYHKRKNVSQTCRHFDIPRKTFYKWIKRYNPQNLYTLEDKSKVPLRKRKREITSLQEMRIVKLRKKHIRYSKFKIAKIYEQTYPEPISSWKVQKVIEKYRLYCNPRKTARITRKRLKAIKKKRIAELKKKPKAGFLLCLDTVEIRWNNIKRYIFTVIDSYSKVAYARMYKSANSYNSADFLNRLMYLNNGNMENIQTDNGSEFQKYFDRACQKLNLIRYYSRVRTPKDNAVCERFNRTLKEEFIQLGNSNSDIKIFNRNLTDWLVEYNFHRPHQSLEYISPVNFTQKYSKVSKRWSSNTSD